MTYTFDQSKDEIARLVKHFSTNQAAFMAPGYKEAQARQEFIDPLFIALNWDVPNRQQVAPDYREVVVEDSLEMAGHEARKAPDYVFRIGRDRKFFAEAKKPGVDLKTAAGPAYQLRRYAWSAKLPLSVLTDFQEWVSYDCRIRPSEGDKTSTARLAYMTYVEYTDRWHEIWDVYSREAVWGGSFDKYAQGGKGKRGTSEVDAEFLKEIEGWRDSLARNIALRNPDLTIDEMNDAVQRTIDRIIFLRMVEARGMEEYGQLQRIADSDNIYANLLVLSIRADAKYNSGLFDFSKKGDQVTPRLTVDDKTLKPILADLYYPQSPYEFSVLPAEILGNVYEQFLGKVIHLTDAHHAKVEEKPEVKKAGGVYYTPSYIVEYIVKNTVGKQIEGKSPAQLKGFRVLDPACGSGSFLLGAYSYLLDYYRNWYGSHEPGKKKDAVAQQADGSWQLTLPERKRILTEHIFGVDIDRQACEVTKLSLLLKVLEGVKQLTLLNERALPNLDYNIKCGNSLIGPDYFAGQMMQDTDDLRRINPFDWEQGFPEVMQAGGFDCVIGNPPYIQLSMADYYDPGVSTYFTRRYSSSMGRTNTFGLFIERSLRSLLAKNGFFSFIVPNTLLTQEYYQALRQQILKYRLENITLYQYPVFTGAVVETIVFVIRNTHPDLNNILIAECDNRTMSYQTREIEQEYYLKTHQNAFLVKVNRESIELRTKLDNSNKIKLMDVANINQAIALKYSRDESLFTKRRGNNYKPVIDGRNIQRYVLEWGGYYLAYDVNKIHSCKRTDIFEAKEKIFFRRVGDRLIATYDDAQYYALNTLVVITLNSQKNISLKYILGILNSRLMNYYYVTYLKSTKKVFSEIQARQISQLPVHPINFSDPSDKAHHDKMISLVEQMLTLHKRKAVAKDAADQERLQRLTDSTDKQIDVLVYELYELTPEEIAIVEGAAKG